MLNTSNVADEFKNDMQMYMFLSVSSHSYSLKVISLMFIIFYHVLIASHGMLNLQKSLRRTIVSCVCYSLVHLYVVPNPWCVTTDGQRQTFITN